MARTQRAHREQGRHRRAGGGSAAGRRTGPGPGAPDRGGRLSTISGGERRRLALARVLVEDRELLILDEPTEHLDSATARESMSDVWRASAGRALLVITHDPELVDTCDRVVRLT